MTPSRPPAPAVTGRYAMICDTCGARYADPALAFCPNCGGILMKDVPRHARGLWQRWDWLRLLSLAFISTLLVLGAMATTVALGIHQGSVEREQRIRAIADQHFAKGEGYLARGDYEIALAEFEYVKGLYERELGTTYPGILEAIARARSYLQSLPSPTSQVQRDAAVAAFNRGKAAFEAGQCEEAITALREAQTFDPSYETEATRQMLYTCYRGEGLALLAGDQLERAVAYLEQAAAIQLLDPDTETQYRRAAAYLTAQRYWGKDWGQAVALLEELYAQAPDYRDVADRLVEAYITYGDLLAQQTEWCPAEAQYAAAVRLRYDEEVERKRINASRACQQATPTPLPGSVSTTVPPGTVMPGGGFHTGKLAYVAYDPALGDSSLYVVYADGLRRERIAISADQPAWSRDGAWLAFRMHGDRPGLYITNGDPGNLTQVVSGTISHPTWSPDGTRLAYAAPDDQGEWTIYIINADGSGTPRAVGKGRWPAWSPSQSLAYTGCDRSGRLCGIFSDSNPDDPEPAVRLTADINDIGLAWSPDGMNIAYMSNHSGNWEVYTVNIWGGVTLLTNDPANDGLPAWAPDGSALAFISDRDGAWGIYLMQPDGSQQRKLLDLGPVYPDWLNQRLAWAP